MIKKKSENTQHITKLCDICLIATAAKKNKKRQEERIFSYKPSLAMCFPSTLSYYRKITAAL